MAKEKFSLKNIFNRKRAQAIGEGISKGAGKVAEISKKTYLSVVPQKGDDPEKWFFKLQIFSILGIAIFVVIAGISVFLLTLKEPEDVVVPNVTNKELPQAILALQAAGLQNYVELKFSNDPKTKGIVIDQDPKEGGAIKAGRKVSLFVSKGAVLDKVGDYSHKNVEEVKDGLRVLFGNNTPLIVLDTISYTIDQSPPGTVLSQDPPPETELTTPVKLTLLVSKGPEDARAKVPNLVGQGLFDSISTLAGLDLPFNFKPNSEGSPGKINDQSPQAGAELSPTDLVTLVFTPPTKSSEGMVFGLVHASLPEYAVPVEVTVKKQDAKGFISTLYRFKTLGGNLTLPVEGQKDSNLIFYVFEKEVYQASMAAVVGNN